MTLRYKTAVLICNLLISSSTFVFSSTSPSSGIAAAVWGSFDLGERLPTITSLSPSSGTTGEVVAVVCAGTNFIKGVTTVAFQQGILVRSVTVQSAERLTAIVEVTELAETGMSDVYVSNNIPGGGTTKTNNSFLVFSPAPVLDDVEPRVIERGEFASLTLTGRNFYDDNVSIDAGPGISLSLVKHISRTELRVEVTVSADASPGSRSLSIAAESAGGKKFVLDDAIVVHNPAPTLTAISPALIRIGQSVDVIFSGSKFLSGITSATLGPGLAVASTEVRGSSQVVLTVTVQAEATVGPRDVRVMNAGPGGGSATLAGALVVGYPEPILKSIAPQEGKRGQSVDIVLTGSEFYPQITEFNLGNKIHVNSFSISRPNQIVASVKIDPESTAGETDVSVSNKRPGGGVATLIKGFTVINPAPVVASLIPSKVGRGTTTTLTLSGSNFFSDATTVQFGPDITLNSMSVRSGSELVLNISVNALAAPGQRSATVSNASPGGGKSVLSNALTITAQNLLGAETSMGSTPEDFVLYEAYPNPFNPTTTIRFGLPEQSTVKLEIHNLIGKVVAELLDAPKPKGYYEIPWTPTDLPSGVYLVRIYATSTDGKSRFVSSRKVVLLK